MTFFSANLKLLRKDAGLTQGELASKIGTKANTISNYESEVSEPDFKTLDKIIKVLGISVNEILYADMGKKTIPKTIPNTIPNAKKAHEMTIVAEDGTVQYGGKSRAIPILDARAAAGWPYTIDHSGFLGSQPTLSLPPPWFRSGEYVLIQIEGDSMHPTIYNGDWVFIRKLEKITEIKDGYVHVVLTRDGIVCKRLLNRVNKGHIALQSDNSTYPTYTVPVDEVLSIWRVEMKMSAILRNENLDIVKRLSTLEADIAEIKAKKKG